jgi:hypothetical protein
VTVYVDDWRQPARVGRIYGKWSHLFAGPSDDVEELHAFAASLGLHREWFQDELWPLAHYDVTESKRRQATALGAVPIGWRQAAHRMREALNQARQAAAAGATGDTS